MRIVYILLISLLVYSNIGLGQVKDKKTENNIIDSFGKTVITRFNPPFDYQRVNVSPNSFGEYLRNLQLRPFGSFVYFFDGKKKANNDIYISVVEMELDKQDLQQCADAVMRLRGEYLFKTKQFKKIHFNFLSDGKPRYFLEYSKGDTTYKSFRKYMRYIFGSANTASLIKELSKVPKIGDIQPGDVFIQTRNPYGHAVIVVDVVVNKKTGKKLYMLAQSYMPAQDTQILINPSNKSISPWYSVNEGTIVTPQWYFESTDLYRFKD